MTEEKGDLVIAQLKDDVDIFAILKGLLKLDDVWMGCAAVDFDFLKEL